MEEKKLPDVLKKETTRRDFLRGTATAAGGALAITAIGGIAPKKAEAQYAVQTAPGTKPYAQKYRFAERQNCTGCRSCEFACSLFHTGNVRPALSRIYIAKYKDIVDVPVMCWHCDDAPCIKACPTTPNSLTKDAKTNGIVLNDEDLPGRQVHEVRRGLPGPVYPRQRRHGSAPHLRPLRRRPPVRQGLHGTVRQPPGALPHGPSGRYRREYGLPFRDA